MYMHSCLKCGGQYTDEDPDPYYCSPCNEERKRIVAKEIDAKAVPTSHVKGNWASFEESQPVIEMNGMRFMR